MIFSVLIFLLTLTLLVIIHELGHYLTARKFNVKVLEFGFGIPPRAWGKKIGETIYSLNWLPIGGFVRLLGEDEVDKEVLDNKRSFASQKVWKRIVIVTSGVVMNLLVAFIIYTGILAVQNFKYEQPLLFPHQFVGVHQQTTETIFINAISPDSPAQAAGLKPGDRILALNDNPVLSGQNFIETVKQNAEKEIKITVSEPDGKNPRSVSVTPRKDPPPGQGALGVGVSATLLATLEYKDLWQKILSGPIHSYNIASVSFGTLGKLIGASFQTKNFEPVSAGVGGPIAIGYFSNIILNEPDPLLKYMDLVAGISLSLAIFNILPIPALDGGRFFFLLIEAFTRKKVKPELEQKIHSIGMAILLCLFILITYKDVSTYIAPEVGKLLR